MGLVGPEVRAYWHDSKAVERRTDQNRGVETVGEYPCVANLSPPQKETADPAATGSTADHWKAGNFHSEVYAKRAEAAMRLGEAIADCEPEDACELMCAALQDFRAQMPVPAFDDVQIEAEDWASFATSIERRAYAWAIWRAMTPREQSRFRDYLRRAC